MILVVGSINMDLVFSVEEIPGPGETVMAGQTRKSPGGKGANQAVAAAKLGGHVVMLGCAGQDAHGEALVSSMAAAGVDTAYLMRREDVDTSCAYICVSKQGENCIVVDSTANRRVSPEYLDAREDLFRKAKYCILQMEIPVETVKHAINLCRKHEVPVLLNPSPLSGFDEKVLQGVDYLIPNEGEAARLTGVEDTQKLSREDWQRFMKKYGIRHVVMTVGSQGAYHYQADGQCTYHPTEPQKAVDTTGAGDTFLGAFAAALADGKTHSEAIAFANRASGIAVTRHGAQSAMPTLEEVLS